MNSPSARAANKRGIGFYFWSTIFALIGITAVLVILAMLRPVPDQSASDTAQSPQISITQEQLAQVEVRARQAGYQAIEANLDDALEQMFQPVYASIPTYADFHYSVWGQYAELWAAGKETLGLEEEIGSLMRKHLFEDFETRHVQQIEHLRKAYQQSVSGIFAQEGERLAGETGQPLPEALQLTLDDAKRRMIVTLPAAATGSAAATAVVVAIVKPIATKVVASTAIKAGAKGVGKATGIGGTAAAGAVAGSFLGPVGTAVGGVGGAVVGWLVVDYAVVRLDEYFNRDEFEAELRDAIDVEKARLRSVILAGYATQQP